MDSRRIDRCAEGTLKITVRNAASIDQGTTISVKKRYEEKGAVNLKKDELDPERLLAEQLMEGGQSGTDPKEEAVRRLPPRWEIRIQTEYDPVAEETAQYRKIAKEVDGRYDGKVGPSNTKEQE